MFCESELKLHILVPSLFNNVFKVSDLPLQDINIVAYINPVIYKGVYFSHDPSGFLFFFSDQKIVFKALKPLGTVLIFFVRQSELALFFGKQGFFVRQLFFELFYQSVKVKIAVNTVPSGNF